MGLYYVFVVFLHTGPYPCCRLCFEDFFFLSHSIGLLLTLPTLTRFSVVIRLRPRLYHLFFAWKIIGERMGCSDGLTRNEQNTSISLQKRRTPLFWHDFIVTPTEKPFLSSYVCVRRLIEMPYERPRVVRSLTTILNTSYPHPRPTTSDIRTCTGRVPVDGERPTVACRIAIFTTTVVCRPRKRN